MTISLNLAALIALSGISPYVFNSLVLPHLEFSWSIQLFNLVKPGLDRKSSKCWQFIIIYHFLHHYDQVEYISHFVFEFILLQSVELWGYGDHFTCKLNKQRLHSRTRIFPKRENWLSYTISYDFSLAD